MIMVISMSTLNSYIIIIVTFAMCNCIKKLTLYFANIYRLLHLYQKAIL